jgi:hypothetical protein
MRTTGGLLEKMINVGILGRQINFVLMHIRI